MRAERLDNCQVKLSSGAWSDTFSEDRRLAWIEFYRRMYEDTAAKSYVQAAEALAEVDG